MGAWKWIAYIVLALVTLLEWRYARECAPSVSSLLARHRAVALDVRCNEATPQYAAWRDHLDCVGPRRTVAKGYVLVMAECMASAHPFAAYWSLVEPLAYPRLGDKPHEWLLAAAFAAAVLWIAAPLGASAISLWREERMRAHFRDDLGAMRSMMERRRSSEAPTNYVYVASSPERRSLDARRNDSSSSWFSAAPPQKMIAHRAEIEEID